MSNKGTALITGPTSGIGYELAKLFAADGHGLVLVARNRDRLEQVASELRSAHGAQVSVIASDLASPTAAAEVFAQLKEPVHILVNNAGFTVFGEFRKTPLEEELSMVAVNIAALTHLTKLYLKQVPTEGERRILNLASTAAFQPGPFMAVYYASKAYVLSFSEALAEELSGSGITVTALCPGPVATNFAARGGMDASPLFKGRIADASSVARAGYRAMKAGRAVYIPNWWQYIMVNSVRLSPRWLVSKIVRKMQAPP